MSVRGIAQKYKNEHEMSIHRAMITRDYWMKWNFTKCVGCEICSIVCPKGALTQVKAVLEDGHMVKKQSVEVDEKKCVNCGCCVEACPTHAICITINGKKENPVLDYGVFPEFLSKTVFHQELFNFRLKDFVIDNCSVDVISYDAERKTMRVDFENCIHCRQCEVASDGAFTVEQAWAGSVELHEERCLPGCVACTEICPTSALTQNNEGKVCLADYYCIKCGACMQICPIKPQYEEKEFEFESNGVRVKRSYQELSNADDLAIKVERWRVNHSPVSSATWVEALRKLSDDKAKAVEIDRKRALKRKDLIIALRGTVVSPDAPPIPNKPAD
ncbi:MAG: 4Fe-4S binding protein [Anaerolineaceae bacterium]|nr:4Fe-4S binding protein [Anaerolineaceae bacterium]